MEIGEEREGEREGGMKERGEGKRKRGMEREKVSSGPRFGARRQLLKEAHISNQSFGRGAAAVTQVTAHFDSKLGFTECIVSMVHQHAARERLEK